MQLLKLAVGIGYANIEINFHCENCQRNFHHRDTKAQRFDVKYKYNKNSFYPLILLSFCLALCLCVSVVKI